MRNGYDTASEGGFREVLPHAVARARLHEIDARRGRPRSMRALAEPSRDVCAQTQGYLQRVEQHWSGRRDEVLQLLVPAWAAHGAYADHYGRLVGFGVEVRVLPEQRPQLTVRESSMAAFNRVPHDKSELVVLRDESSVAALRSLFDALWSTAAPFIGARRVVLDDADRTLLHWLATGATDAAVARALGTSERTVRRRVAQLMDRYGAQSRFQLGVLSARDRDGAAAPSRPVVPHQTEHDRAG